MASKIHISIRNTNVGVENGRGLVWYLYYGNFLNDFPDCIKYPIPSRGEWHSPFYRQDSMLELT